MVGRVKRRAGLAEAEARAAREAPPPPCPICGRALGVKVEWHHLVPKSEGGRVTAAVHPICHRTVHALIPNAELARTYADPVTLAAHPGIARFVAWVADKPADFHAPTRRSR
ncbi:HNH endonuclease [Sphingomonas taxi]|uniref:HNH endonuclease n=1 Tax=Sphingomonas taxi TaxID=1549858 RepID=A0A097EHI5_9SPHN|nr:HNH endonuclease [Sphingomonas taxi]AIT07026.1 HNH endonuclease [Sphingomonas taxi]